MKFIKILFAILSYLLLYLVGVYAIPEILATFDVNIIPYYFPFFLVWGTICLLLLIRSIKKISNAVEEQP